MQAAIALVRPTPWIYVNATEMCLLTGILMPAIRAMFLPALALPLLMSRIAANDPNHAAATDDLAVSADLSH
jgi:hypothetical protein